MKLKHMNFDTSDWIAEEYRAIRAEVILCLERRITILSYGFTAIGAILAAAISIWRENKEIFVLAMIFINPTICWFSLQMWLTETRRLRRASHYLWRLEIKASLLNEYNNNNIKPLEWEGRLRYPGSHGEFTEHYSYTILFFYLISVSCSSFGLYALLKHVFPNMIQSLKTDNQLAGLSFIIASLVLLIPTMRSYKHARWIREYFNKHPSIELEQPNK